MAKWTKEKLIDEIVENEGIPGHVIENMMEDRYVESELLEMNYDKAYEMVVNDLEDLSDTELDDYGL